MTIREYLTSKLEPLSITAAAEADFEIASGISVLENITADNIDDVNRSVIGVIEFLLFAPRLSNISESGFSQSWDYSNLGKLYMWLCRKYGVTPNEDATDLLGLSMIKNISNYW